MTQSVAASKWASHPLYESKPGTIPVNVNSTIKVWDNANYTFVPFASRNVRLDLRISDSNIQTVATLQTDQNGAISDTIYVNPFEILEAVFSTSGMSVGNTSFTFDYAMQVPPAIERTNYFPAVLKLPRFISETYAPFDLKRRLLPEILLKENRYTEVANFELGYDKTHFNVLFEGDSWLDCKTVNDIYKCLTASIENGISGATPAFLPLQKWGDRATDMLATPSGSFSDFPHETPTANQDNFLRAFLERYKFDFVFLSLGGNDIALSLKDLMLQKSESQLDADYQAFISTYPSFTIDLTKTSTLNAAAAEAISAVDNMNPVNRVLRFPNLPSQIWSVYDKLLNIFFDRTKLLIKVGQVKFCLKAFLTGTNRKVL